MNVVAESSEVPDATPHSEQLGVSVYCIAQASLGLLAAMCGPQDDGGVAQRMVALWPDNDVLFALQRQCLAVASDIEQREVSLLRSLHTDARLRSRCAFVNTVCPLNLHTLCKLHRHVASPNDVICVICVM